MTFSQFESPPVQSEDEKQSRQKTEIEAVVFVHNLIVQVGKLQEVIDEVCEENYLKYFSYLLDFDKLVWFSRVKDFTLAWHFYSQVAHKSKGGLIGSIAWSFWCHFTDVADQKWPEKF